MKKTLVTGILTLALGLLSFVLPSPAHADDTGFRWGRFDTICVWRVSPTKPGYLVKEAVAQWNAHPDIKIEFHSATTCAKYAQRIQIREFRYGADKSPAWIRYTGTSFPTPCASHCDGYNGYWGADVYGNWDWMTKSYPTIRVNESHRWSYSGYRAAIAHEVGHALGLSHTDRCDSVMSETCFSRYKASAYDNSELERIYPW